MTTQQQREAFEAAFPPPGGVEWHQDGGCYIDHVGSADIEKYDALWTGWQAAQAQQGEGEGHHNAPVSGEALRHRIFKDWPGCSNHGCIVTGPKSGMGTNGPCGCLMNASRAQLNTLKSRLQAVFSESQPAQQVPQWISHKERLPIASDYDGNGNLWAWNTYGKKAHLITRGSFSPEIFSHWMCTNHVKPQGPDTPNNKDT